MNILMQTAGLILLLLLLYFYLRQDRIELYTGRVFVVVLILAVVSVSLDILSVVLLSWHESVPDILVRFVCKGYIASLFWVVYSVLAYAFVDFYADNRLKQRRMIVGYGIFAICGTFVIFLLPIYYYVDAAVCYSYGPSTVAAYAAAIFLILVILVLCFWRQSHMNPKRRRALRIWMALWLMAAAVQIVDRRLLVIGYAAALGMMILFFEFENPEANVDRATGFFHSNILMEYMKEQFMTGRPFSLLLISMEEYRKGNISYQQIDQTINEIGAFMRKIPGVKIFKNVEQDLILLFATPREMELAYQDYIEYWQKNQLRQGTVKKLYEFNPFLSWEPLHIMLPDNRIVSNAREIMDLLKYSKQLRGGQQEDKLIVITESMAKEYRERYEIEKIIVSAIHDDRVEVFYQPIYSIQKKAFTSAEALVRIRDRDGSIIPPGKFIPIAEENGLIVQLGNIVFEKTCAFIRRNPLEKLGLEYIESNLSVAQCENLALSETYIHIMEEHELNPANVNLEITETASVSARKMLLENMEVLIDYGVSFSLDDFGSGNSNLNYIVEMPVSIVKFDMEMTGAYFSNDKARLILPAAMQMIHNMDLKVVAEGVETVEQLTAMEELGIDYIQGYYFSRPLEEQEFLRFLTEKNQTARLSAH